MSFDFFEGTSLVVTGDPTALVEYTTGSLSLCASATQPSDTYDDGFGEFDSHAFAVGAAYSAGAYKLSVGYEMYEQDGYADDTAENWCWVPMPPLARSP